jgi:Glucodextranase, domain B
VAPVRKATVLLAAAIVLWLSAPTSASESPFVTITHPTSGATTEHASVTVTGTAHGDDGRLVSLRVNGHSVRPDASGKWRLKLSLHPGPNVIRVVGTDSTGEVSDARVKLIRLIRVCGSAAHRC